ncbi:hypothetical protein [uncultured Flavobacterium sp.]|uniref:hypothetical protein n=1 Tax=uncultured Flavobacterium sp. TaxID=165435 RepID=UPI0030820A2D
MAQILITYDLQEDSLHPSKHIQVKDEMKKLGYMDSWSSDGVTYTLPNTTLWKNEATTTQAKTDLENSAKKFGATVERFVAVEFTNWDAIQGKPYKK